VNGETISTEQFQSEFKKIKRRFRVGNKIRFSSDELLWLKLRTLNVLIRETLFRQEAGKYGIKVSRKELDEALRHVRGDYQEDSFQRYLEIEDIHPRELEKSLKTNILVKSLIARVVDSRVTEQSVNGEEMQAYYDQHLGEFKKKEQVRALHIMVETEEEAREILKKIRSGRREFSELAREHSRGPEAPTGGDLGYFEKGQMPQEFDSVFDLKINQVSEVIRTPFGFHIFKVKDKRPERKMSFEESRNIILKKKNRQYQERIFHQWLQEVKSHASIQINDEVIAKND